MSSAADTVPEEAMWLQALNEYADWILENEKNVSLTEVASPSPPVEKQAVDATEDACNKENSTADTKPEIIQLSKRDCHDPIDSTQTAAMPVIDEVLSKMAGESSGRSSSTALGDTFEAHCAVTKRLDASQTESAFEMYVKDDHSSPDPMLPPSKRSNNGVGKLSTPVPKADSRRRPSGDRFRESETQVNQDAPARSSKEIEAPNSPSADCQKSLRSGLSSLIDDFSAYSGSHKQEMKDLVDRFSVSAISTIDESDSARMSDSGGPKPLKFAGKNLDTSMRFNSHDMFWGEYSRGSNDPLHRMSPLRPPIRYPVSFLFNSGHTSQQLHLPSITPGRRELSVNVNIQSLRNDFKVLERVDWRDDFGNTSLHYAAAWGTDYKLLSTLIDQVHNINSVNISGQTFMHVLCSVLEPISALPDDHLLPLIDKLKRCSFHFDLRDHYGYVVSHCLARLGYSIAKSPSLRDPRGPGWNTVFDMQIGILAHSPTASARFMASLRDILERGAKKEPPKTLSSLYMAVDSCHAAGDLVTPTYMLGLPKDKLLWQFRTETYFSSGWAADDKTTGRTGRIGLHSLADDSWSSRHVGWTETSEEVTRMQKYLMESLLRNGADVNAYSLSISTPLMAFAEATHMQDRTLEFMLVTMIQHGACVNQRDLVDRTPLHIAVASGNVVATRVFIEHGANVHARDLVGQGIVALGNDALKAAASVASSYAKIAVCVALAIDAGAVREPDEIMEWTMPKASLWKDRSA